MMMRTIPPAAAPLGMNGLWHGVRGGFSGERCLERLQREIRDYFGVRHVFLVSSGSAALVLILTALHGLAPMRRRVVIPAYTCFSVPAAVLMAELQVSLCDVDPTTFDYDRGLLSDAITDDTLCVVAGHLFGVPSDLDRICRLAAERGSFVVEDAAQAMGGRYRGKWIGTCGDVGFYSFGRGKNITCGSGGVIVTNSDRIAKALTRDYAALHAPTLGETLRDFCLAVGLAIFTRPSFYWLPTLLPFLRLGETRFVPDFPIKRLSPMKAGLLRNWRTDLEAANRVRLANGAYFRSRLGLALGGDPSVPYLRLPVVLDDPRAKAQLCSASRAAGLGVSAMYPTSVADIPEVRRLLPGVSTPSARRIAERLVTIPTHHFVTERDRAVICEAYEQAVGVRSPASGAA